MPCRSPAEEPSSGHAAACSGELHKPAGFLSFRRGPTRFRTLELRAATSCRAPQERRGFVRLDIAAPGTRLRASGTWKQRGDALLFEEQAEGSNERESQADVGMGPATCIESSRAWRGRLQPPMWVSKGTGGRRPVVHVIAVRSRQPGGSVGRLPDSTSSADRRSRDPQPEVSRTSAARPNKELLLTREAAWTRLSAFGRREPGGASRQRGIVGVAAVGSHAFGVAQQNSKVVSPRHRWAWRQTDSWRRALPTPPRTSMSGFQTHRSLGTDA